jgi:hypothetical protein
MDFTIYRAEDGSVSRMERSQTIVVTEHKDGRMEGRTMLLTEWRMVLS